MNDESLCLEMTEEERKQQTAEKNLIGGIYITTATTGATLTLAGSWTTTGSLTYWDGTQYIDLSHAGRNETLRELEEFINSKVKSVFGLDNEILEWIETKKKEIE